MDIKFTNVFIKYKDDELLNDLNLEFKPGKLYGIYGKSGVGKTTLLKAILNNKIIASGDILIDDKSTSKMKAKEFKKIKNNFAFLFQETGLLDNLDVYENIKLKLDEKYKNWFFKLFKILTKDQLKELNDILNSLEIADKIFTPVKFLSGGQKHRVEIAALLFEPKKVILADEPTTGLDSLNSKHIFKLLKEYAIQHNAIVICNIHDIENSLDYIDEAIFLKDKIAIKNFDFKKLTKKEIDELYE
ncbi:ATP-binding cassette domain-containing protein [Mycoplasmopsis adleri]|uniref:ATP-binding cassette domain-containing protein n=1 Tax=Mycoplasmopsis adleri TaxID=51362 RepID=UPI00387338C2